MMLHAPTKFAYNRVTSGYGKRILNGKTNDHKGLDYGWGLGWGIYAALAGTVESVDYTAGYNKGWGGRMVINHGYGVKTTYNHLNSNSNIGIKKGSKVKRGQHIANIGNPTTGLSRDPHLHFELLINGTRVNPMPYFTKHLPGIPQATSNPIKATQRVVKSDLLKRRAEPTSKSKELQPGLAKGTIGNFVGWKYGEKVNGINVWFKGISGDWFWAGGFTSAATTGLENLNPKAPTTPPKPSTPAPKGVVRKANKNGVYGRTQPTSKATSKGMLNPNTEDRFVNYTVGESVSGNNIWFQSVKTGLWYWSGGFTTKSTTGMTKVTTTTVTPPPVVKPETPAVKPTTKVSPVYPGAVEGWDIARGREDREPKAPYGVPVIDGLAIHHTGTTGDSYNVFKEGKSSLPTWYVDGKKVVEFVRPAKRPITTASHNNWTVSIETRNTKGGPQWLVSNDSLEEIAKIAAWLYSFNGKKLDGKLVKFELDRKHIKGHNEFSGNATECPGPYLLSKLDAIIARAKVIYAEKYAPKPPVVVVPEKPTVPANSVIIDVQVLKNLQTQVKAIDLVLTKLIGDKK